MKEPWEIDENYTVPLSWRDLESMRNILFLRMTLVELVQKCLHVLITSQQTYGYSFFKHANFYL